MQLGSFNSQPPEGGWDDGKYPKGLEPERFDVEELLNHKQDEYLHNSPQADLAREMDEYLSFVTSSEFKGNERLFPSETKLNKQHEEYEVWLDRQNMKMLSEAIAVRLSILSFFSFLDSLYIFNFPHK